MTTIDKLDKVAKIVLEATRTRYMTRVADTTVVDAIANKDGLGAKCKGTEDYTVVIMANFNPYMGDEGEGEIACTCEEFKRMNPAGTIARKMDPCKHIAAVAHRWANRTKEDKGAEEAKEIAKPTHRKFGGLVIRGETDKAIYAEIGGVLDWFPKTHIIVKGNEVAVTCWMAETRGCEGGEEIVVPKAYKGGWKAA